MWSQHNQLNLAVELFKHKNLDVTETADRNYC